MSSPLFDLLSFSSQEMEMVEKLKTANANLEQRKEELVKELEQVTKLWALFIVCLGNFNPLRSA